MKHIRLVLQFVVEHIFIFAAGIAALDHSMWTLGMMYTGKEPSFVTDFGPALIAFMMAAAIDIGQIATSHDIKKGNRSWIKYGTFFVFAMATYYLQWVYMTHHVPMLALGLGIRAEWTPLVQFGVDLSIWIVPALLPLSTLLYTFSQTAQTKTIDVGGTLVTVDVKKSPNLGAGVGLMTIKQTAYAGIEQVGEEFRVVCPKCARIANYKSLPSAQAGYRGHVPNCKGAKGKIEAVESDSISLKTEGIRELQ